MSMGYDAPSSSSFPQFDSRRTSGSIASSYDRSASRQRSPSPGLSRRTYDSYVPHRSENIAYRNTYRPNIYRPDHSSYYPRSPSPDNRTAEPPSYRGSSWRPRQLPPSPPSRRFEPSDSWKYSYVDRSGREYVPPSDRHIEHRGRNSVDASPERSPRFDRSSYVTVPDRHATVHLKRETWPERRPFMDSYRPNYDNDRSPLPRRDLPHSPTSHTGRDSESSAYARASEYAEYVRPNPRKPSTASFVHSPTDPPWSPTSLVALKRDPPPRQASRSSIASTHVSDRISPGAASIPQPSIPVRLPASLPAKPQAAIDALANEKRRDLSKPGTKTAHNGVVPQVPANIVEAEQAAKPALTAKREILDNVPNGLTVDSQNSGVEDSSSTPNLLTEPAVIETTVAPASISPESPSITAPPTIQAMTEISPAENVITTNGICVGADVELKQPKPISPLECTPTIIEMLDDEIPPPTHSPSLSPEPAKGPDSETVNSFLVHTTLPKPEDIPPLSSAKTKEEALRITVMTRILRDHQSREARINPILVANRAIAPPSEVHPTSTPTTLLDKMLNGLTSVSRLESAHKTRPMLVKYFAQRQAMVDDKTNKLREEYALLYERWAAHCTALNEQQRSLASEQENQPPLRTTRRSIAITDAVRSDFEMEQIIASLGNDDATDPIHLSIRNQARVPDMISVVNGKLDAVFDDRNDLVENPAEYYAPHTGIHDWTDAEKKTFMEKFGAFPKQFGVIADYLPNKSAAQCVEYYYLHKKMFIDFRRVISQYAPNKRKRRGMGRKKGNGLLADIAMHDLEVHRGSGSASPSTSAPALRASRGRRTLHSTAPTKPPSSRRNAVQFEETPTSTPTPEPESRTRKRKVASGASTPNASVVPSISTSVVTSSSTTSLTAAQSIHVPHSTTPPPIVQSTSLAAAVEEDEAFEQGSRPVKRPKRTRKIKSAVMVLEEPASPTLQTLLLPPNEVTESASWSGRKEKVADPLVIDWSEQDKAKFLSLYSQYGSDIKQIALSMPYKTISQITSYYMSNQSALNPVEETSNSNPRWTMTPDPESLWTAKPVSGPPLPSNSRLSPPTNHVNLISTSKPTSINPPGYDQSPYQPVSGLPYRRHGSPSEDIRSSWTAPPLPTRLSQRTNFSTLPGASVSGRADSNQLPSGSRHQAVRSSPTLSGMAHAHYPYSPPLSESPRAYTSRTNSIRYSGEPDSLPSRRSSGSRVTLSPNLSSRSPQSHRQYPRPRISTSTSSSLIPHAPPAPGLGYDPALPGSTSCATAIVHSPTISSPQLPLHHSPLSYGQHPLPPRSDPRSGSDAREGHRYLPPTLTRSPVNHQHPKQRSLPSASGWDLGQTSSPRQRHYSMDGHHTTSGLYNRPRGASFPEPTGGHGRAGVSIDKGRDDSFPAFSSIVLPTSSGDYRPSPRPNHSLPVLWGENAPNQVDWR